MTFGSGKPMVTYAGGSYGGRGRRRLSIRRFAKKTKGRGIWSDLNKGFKMGFDDWILPLTGMLAAGRRRKRRSGPRRKRGGMTRAELEKMGPLRHGYIDEGINGNWRRRQLSKDEMRAHYGEARRRKRGGMFIANPRKYNNGRMYIQGIGRRKRGGEQLPRYLPGLSREDQKERYYQLFGPPEAEMDGDGRRRRRRIRRKKGGSFGGLSRSSYNKARDGYHGFLNTVSRPIQLLKDMAGMFGHVAPLLGGKRRRRGGNRASDVAGAVLGTLANVNPLALSYNAVRGATNLIRGKPILSGTTTNMGRSIVNGIARLFGRGKRRGRGPTYKPGIDKTMFIHSLLDRRLVRKPSVLNRITNFMRRRGRGQLRVRGPGLFGRFANYMRSGPAKHRIFKALPFKSRLSGLADRGYGKRGGYNIANRLPPSILMKRIDMSRLPFVTGNGRRRRRPHRRIRRRGGSFGGASILFGPGRIPIVSNTPRSLTQAFRELSKHMPDRFAHEFPETFRKTYAGMWTKPIVPGVNPGRLGKFLNRLKSKHYYWWKKAPRALKSIAYKFGNQVAKKGMGRMRRRPSRSKPKKKRLMM